MPVSALKNPCQLPSPHSFIFLPVTHASEHSEKFCPPLAQAALTLLSHFSSNNTWTSTIIRLWILCRFNSFCNSAVISLHRNHSHIYRTSTIVRLWILCRFNSFCNSGFGFCVGWSPSDVSDDHFQLTLIINFSWLRSQPSDDWDHNLQMSQIIAFSWLQSSSSDESDDHLQLTQMITFSWLRW